MLPLAFGSALILVSPQTQVATMAVEAAAQPSAAAQAIAERLASDAAVIEQTRRVLRAQLPASLAANPDMQAMEKHWPGIMVEFIHVMEPIIVAALPRRLPNYRFEIACFFDKSLTQAEVKEVEVFYASPVGQRLITQMRNGADFTKLIGEQIKSGGDTTITAQDLGGAITPAVQPAVSSLSTEDQLRLVDFSMSSAGRKLTSLNPQLLDLSARFSNAEDPEVSKQIQQAVRALVARRSASGRSK